MSIQPSQQRLARLNFEKQGKQLIGMSPDIFSKASYNDLKALQVKTVSFIAYILRSYADSLKEFQDKIADAVIQLMLDCSSEAANIRKELLVATRHIWFTDFRASFVKYIDVLLNEDVLLGLGLTCRETLRPLAHSVLVDLIHHVRSDLTQEQIIKAVYIYERNLNDSSFAPNIQTMCVKLLVNLVDCIVKLEPNVSKVLLYRILRAFSVRLNGLRDEFPVVLAVYQKRQKGDKFEVDDGYLDIGYIQPIKISTRALDLSQDLGKDYRFLLKNLIQGIKNIVFAMLKIQADSPSFLVFSWEQELSLIYGDIFDAGLKAFDYFIMDGYEGQEFVKSGDKMFYSSREHKVVTEEKETIETFATIFGILDGAMFQEIFTTRIESIVKVVMHNSNLAAICQYFLSSSGISANFAGLLLDYLMKHFEDLGSLNQNLSSTNLKLFKLVFVSIAYFPDKIESVLRPHLTNIIMSSFKYAGTKKESLNFFQVLRALFRAIAGGRYEMLYQEVIPLLQVILENLNTLLLTASSQSLKELFAELCLTVPVRLSVLLPYLSYLMQPLICALHSSGEFSNQGLRTLELCMDNLTQEFLDPIFAPVSKDIMKGLVRHLGGGNSVAAVRILGKLGGKNRRGVNVDVEEKKKSGLSLSFSWKGYDGVWSIELREILEEAYEILTGEDETYLREQAFEFVKGCVPLLLDFDLGDIYRVFGAVKHTMEEDEGPFDKPLSVGMKMLEQYNDVVGMLLESIFRASLAGIADAKEVARRLCVYFSVVAATESKDKKASVAFVCAVSGLFCDPREDVGEYAKTLFSTFYDSLAIISESENLAVTDEFLDTFVIKCYSKLANERQAGCVGLQCLLGRFGDNATWMLKHELELMKALLYVLKETSEFYSSATGDAKQLILKIVKVCHEDGDITKASSLISLFISELPNPYQSVREVVKEGLEALATFSKTHVSDILNPVKEKLLAPIFAKPLRALPFAMQIGNIDAVTYCLGLTPSLVVFGDELLRLLLEALALGMFVLFVFIFLLW